MKITVDKNLEEFLKEFDLNEREIIIYLTLLKTGPNTIMNLARETSIKRSTTHNNVEELIKKGLVSQTNYGERRMVVAEDPDKLKFIMDQKKWRIKKLEDGLPNVIESIQKMVPQTKDNKDIEVKYYEGVEGFRDVCNRSLDHADNEILFLSNHSYWRKVYTKEYDTQYYVPERTKRGIQMKSLVINNDEGETLKKSSKGILRETRFLPKEFDFKTTFIIYKDEISIMVSDEPYTAINIKSKMIFEAFKNIFENLWELSNNK